MHLVSHSVLPKVQELALRKWEKPTEWDWAALKEMLTGPPKE